MIILEHIINQDSYVDYVCEKFDIQNREKVITTIPTLNVGELQSFNWNIGLICGNSGSGKSTILKHLGELRTPTYDMTKCVCSQFPHLTESEVCELLMAVGLASVPTWLRLPNQLSNGEKARLDICWLLANAREDEIILIDEFTSTVNRSAASSISYGLARYVRQKNLKVILASCHFDIIPWLNTDFVFNLNKQENGECEIERFIYTDSKEYETYKNIKEQDELTDRKPITL